MGPHLLWITTFACFGISSFARHDTSGTHWRANQQSLSDEARLYSTRLPIKVEFFGNRSDFLRWQPPLLCAASNSVEVETEITCNKAGLHRVELQYLNDGECDVDSRILIVKKSPLCYGWYVVTLKGESSSSEQEFVIRVWVWDPLHASTGEIKHTTTNPSQFSKTLTKLFAAKGQKPMIVELLPYPRPRFTMSNHRFMESEGVWEFIVRMSERLTCTIRVTGKENIAAHGCFIRHTKAQVSWPDTDEIGNILQSQGSLTLRGHVGVTKVITDPCNSNTAVLILGQQCLVTLDGFQSSVNVSTTSQLLNSNSAHVKNAAITSNYFVYLMEDGILLAQNRTSGMFHLLTDTAMIAIQGKGLCQHSETHETENDMFLSWDADRLYIWHGAEITDTINVNSLRLVDLGYPLWLRGKDVRLSIAHAAFTPAPEEVVVLVGMSADDEMPVCAVIRRHQASNSWGASLPFFITECAVNASVSMVHMHGSEGNIIFWDKSHVYYSYTGGRNIGEMSFLNTVGYEHEISPAIKQLLVTVTGNIIVTSSTNVLYTSQNYQETFIKHAPLASTDADIAVYSNQIDEMFLLQFKDSILQRIGYSLKPEIKTIVDQIDPNLCQFVHFEQGPSLQMSYMDMRDEAVLWSELIFSTDTQNDIKIDVTSPDKITVTEEVIRDFYPGRESVKKVLTVRSNFHFNQPENYQVAVTSATGFITMEMRPQRMGVGCHSPNQLVSQLEIGCPPGRHIRVQKPVSCHDHLGSFTIDANSYSGWNGQVPTSGIVTEYDNSTYGCPITETASRRFKPVIELYDDDTFVETMTADYVVWEENKRHDFDYTITMAQAGCLQEAQTWPRMNLEQDDRPTQPEIWGPHNYESCFVYKVTDQSLMHQSYQVLNHSGLNSIKWETNGDRQLFLFSLHVVDPYYSFCLLETKVAVIVSSTGLTSASNVPVLRICLGTFAGLTFALLLTTFLYYRQSHIQELAMDLQYNYKERADDESEAAPEEN